MRISCYGPYVINKHKAVQVEGAHLRSEVNNFILENKSLVLAGKPIQVWIEEVEGGPLRETVYEEELRNGMCGGVLEILVVAHLYEVQFKSVCEKANPLFLHFSI